MPKLRAELLGNVDLALLRAQRELVERLASTTDTRAEAIAISIDWDGAEDLRQTALGLQHLLDAVADAVDPPDTEAINAP